MSPSEYLESFKVGVYLQDVIKIILDRRLENPNTILVQYMLSALEGEHVLLWEYAFIIASPHNRKMFIQQIKKVFHQTPCFKIYTALDYLQLLVLVCPEFPKSLMIEAAKVIPLVETGKISTMTGDELLFEKYDLLDLQSSMCVFFYF
jgi:hypothetical protein